MRDIEAYMPALSPVVLDAGAKAAGDASPRSVLLGGFDADRATLARAALVDLDLAAFGPAARDELAIAQRRLAGTASLSAGAEPVTAGRLAVLAAPLGGAKAGTLAYVQTSGGATVAWLAPGSRVHPETGGVLLPRTVVPMSRVPHAMAKGTGSDEADQIFKFADMAKPFLPPEAAAGLSIAKGLVELFAGGGPSDVEIIIEAVQRAIQTAVVDLESFIAQEKVNDIKAVIDSAYHWLSVCAGQVKAAREIGPQLTYARLALTELPAQIRALGPALERLTTISVQADAGKELHARVRAAKLLAHGAAGLFTLQKLRIQFEAFLAVRTDEGPKAAAEHRNLVDIHYEDYRHDIQDGDGYAQAYRTMLSGILRDRAATLHVALMPWSPFPVAHAAQLDDYANRMEMFTWEQWQGVIRSLNRDPEPKYDGLVFNENAAALVAFIVADFAETEGLNAALAQMDRYAFTLIGWRLALDGWNQSQAA